MTICCIIVCYRPDVARLTHLCESVLSGCSKVIVVDNTEVPYLDHSMLPQGCSLITLGQNTGIAHAQNVGVAAALSAGAGVLVFFDQDSRVEPPLLESLLAAVHQEVAEIVSPLCVDDATGLPLPSLRLDRLGRRVSVHLPHATARYPVDIVISSGTVATRQVFESAGNFDEGLFIDHVDTDWCLRCRARQIPIYVVPTAVMPHRIGSRHFNFGPWTIMVHSPTRCYYQIRNSILIVGKPHVPLLFALRQVAGVALNRIVLLLFVKRRFSYLKSYLFAVRDGLKGVTGAKPGLTENFL